MTTGKLPNLGKLPVHKPKGRPGQDKNLNLQLDDLKKAGCQRIFQEKVSAVKERPQLQKLLETLREDDTVIVWKLDRLGRSLKDLFTLINDFQARGIGFRSLNDAIDTTTAQGRLIFNIFASLAEFERDLIRERTKAGLAAARARGRVGGRPKGLSAEAQIKARAVKSMHALKTHTILEIGQLFHLSRATVYRYLAWQASK